MIYRRGFGIHWDYTTGTRLTWPPSPWSPSCLPGLKVLRERVGRVKNSLKVILVLRWGATEGGRLFRQSECPSGKCFVANRETSVSVVFCFRTSTSHYQLAGQSANSFDRLLGWREGEFRNSTEGHWKVLCVQTDPGQSFKENTMSSQCLSWSDNTQFSSMTNIRW